MSSSVLVMPPDDKSRYVARSNTSVANFMSAMTRMMDRNEGLELEANGIMRFEMKPAEQKVFLMRMLAITVEALPLARIRRRR